jgi:2-hydroxycyclohexanecarboxyl-CoA dehydrogenase
MGRAIAIQLARDGAAVAVWDLNGDGATSTAGTIVQSGGAAIACTVDVSLADAVTGAAARTRRELGPITILVNNAGISGFCPLLDLTEEMWDRIMRVNLKGPFLCARAIVPDMLAAGWGRIVNISSSSTQQGARNMAHYVASKGGVAGFTKALAMEFVSRGITVNTVAPGFVDTPMLRASPVDVEAAAAASPMGRPGQPEDIAAACSYLVSEAAAYITGQTISANGGRYLL